jgi:serine/threonine protein kinase/Flp pilus assembly protein TadD
MSDVARMPGASAEALLGGLVDEYLDRLARGERPEVEDYARRYPQLATVLRRMLPALLALHGPGADPPEAGEALDAGDDPGAALGDFRIVREVGRGGMGVVYEAEQTSLGRRVALKVLPFAAALDERRLQRFRNEAQAAAHLHHQNIVPVYAVGCERGVHYYAMQYIEGRTVAELIASARRQADPAPAGPAEAATPPAAALPTEAPLAGPAYCRAAAGLAVQAAEALEHAHGQGVVHRDVKPANLLVDARGNLWVTDFGLAQVRTDVRLTLTGDLVGTLRYMSPEQALARGAAVDHRTDVYSLGATLYELLALEPAFDGDDRQELLRQIAWEEPRPLRQVARAVPADLETIVLKAMAKDPAERYATAQELADDLKRFLKDEPVLARRPGLVQRARKWARRHRPAVWSAGAALVVALAALAGSVGWVVRDRAARQARAAADLQAALHEAQRARDDRKWPQAEAAARRAEALLADGAADAELAGRVQRLLRELAEEEADGRMVARLEEVRLLQAAVNEQENRFALERAMPEYRRAFETYGCRAGETAAGEAAARIGGRPPAVRGTLVAALDHWLDLAREAKASELSWLGEVLAAADADPWRQRLREARRTRDRRALEQLAREVDVTRQPPQALFLLDRSLQAVGAVDSAVALLRRAQEAFPGDFWTNQNLGTTLAQGPSPQLDEAIRFLTAAVALRPDSPGARLNLAAALYRRGRLDEAIAGLRKVIQLDPAYAEAYDNLGLALADKGRLDEAMTAYRRAAELKPTLAEAHHHLGVILARKGRFDEAIAAEHRAIALTADLAAAQFNLGIILNQVGRADEAVAPLRRATDLSPEWTAAHYHLGNALWAGGRLGEAVTAYRRAIELRPDYAEAHCNLGSALQQQGEFDQALAAVKRGHELGSARPGWRYPSARWVRECERLIELSGRLSAVLRGESHPAGAREQNEYARLCYYKKHYAASARLWAEAFAAEPSLAEALDDGPRYDAACAAALAAAGQGVEPKERARWRKQALAWLRADLAANGKLLEGGKPEAGRLVRQRLLRWQGDPALAGLRDPAAVALLSAGEAEACRQLWAEVGALLDKATAAAQAG